MASPRTSNPWEALASPARRAGEAAAEGLVGNLELLESLGLPRAQELQGPVQEVERHRRRVGYEVDAGPVALDGVGALGHVPHDLHLGGGGRLRGGVFEAGGWGPGGYTAVRPGA